MTSFRPSDAVVLTVGEDEAVEVCVPTAVIEDIAEADGILTVDLFAERDISAVPVPIDDAALVPERVTIDDSELLSD